MSVASTLVELVVGLAVGEKVGAVVRLEICKSSTTISLERKRFNSNIGLSLVRL